MKGFIDTCGTVAGVLGELICLGAIVGRYYSEPTVMGYDAGTVLTLGIAFVAVGCFKKLWAQSMPA